MSLPVPSPVSPVPKSPSQDLSFRLHERVTAQVVQVSGVTAILSVDGYPVVARLTSKEQAAELLSRRSADFVVTHLSRDEVTLKFANRAGQVKIQLEGAKRDLAADLARRIGLSGTDNEITLIRAGLAENVPITKELVTQLLEAIRESGLDDRAGISLAVKLKAAGLPVTASSLQMVNHFGELRILDSYTGLVSALHGVLPLLEKDALLAKQVQAVLGRLEAMIPDLSAKEEVINACLQEFFRFIGKPYERLFREQEDGGQPVDDGAFDLLALFRLGRDLQNSGHTQAAAGIDRFLEQVRQDQFANIKAETTPGKGTWGEVNFVVQWPVTNHYQASAAKVRVSYRQDRHPETIDAGFTNLVLQVDLAPAKEVIFNLSLYQKKIFAEIAAPDRELTGMLHDSLPEFEDLMNSLGYSLVHASVHQNTGDHGRASEPTQTGDLPVSSVDIGA